MNCQDNQNRMATVTKPHRDRQMTEMPRLGDGPMKFRILKCIVITYTRIDKTYISNAYTKGCCNIEKLLLDQLDKTTVTK